ncbi:helix-turn-helix domain-containing protein [Micromonospora sp. NPDC001898]|uniref:helix-turn-helix domain-containing protein n=1 Tax=Micromonospora sp. NPDC001898 TaxID=3364221 RepID=UPI00367F6DA9
MNASRSVPLTLYRPSEVAERLRCSQWWVKEQARRRRVPYCWIGGSYRFTEEHIVAIARRFEVEALDTSASARRADRVVTPPATQEGGPVIRLSARAPRRARQALSTAA